MRAVRRIGGIGSPTQFFERHRRILLDYLEGGEPLEEFLDNYPSVSREQAIGFLEEAGRAALAQIA